MFTDTSGIVAVGGSGVRAQVVTLATKADENSSMLTVPS